MSLLQVGKLCSPRAGHSVMSPRAAAPRGVRSVVAMGRYAITDAPVDWLAEFGLEKPPIDAATEVPATEVLQASAAAAADAEPTVVVDAAAEAARQAAEAALDQLASAANYATESLSSSAEGAAVLAAGAVDLPTDFASSITADAGTSLGETLSDFTGNLFDNLSTGFSDISNDIRDGVSDFADSISGAAASLQEVPTASGFTSFDQPVAAELTVPGYDASSGFQAQAEVPVALSDTAAYDSYQTLPQELGMDDAIEMPDMQPAFAQAEQYSGNAAAPEVAAPEVLVQQEVVPLPEPEPVFAGTDALEREPFTTLEFQDSAAPAEAPAQGADMSDTFLEPTQTPEELVAPQSNLTLAEPGGSPPGILESLAPEFEPQPGALQPLTSAFEAPSGLQPEEAGQQLAPSLQLEQVQEFGASLGEDAASQMADLTSSVTDLTTSVRDSVTLAKDQAVQAATGAVTGAINQASSLVQGVTSTVGGAASQAVDTATGAVTSTVGSAVQGVESTLGAARDTVWAAVPNEAQTMLSQVGGSVGAAANFVADYPVPSLVALGGVMVPVAVGLYRARYGGYAGDVSPYAVYEMLSTEDPLLIIDVRPDIVRENEGLLELRLAARFKAAALPLSVAQAQVQAIEPRTMRVMNGSRQELVLAVHATFIAGLKQLSNPLARVVVMDEDGGQLARSVARALRAEGVFSAYVMEGGFEGWQGAGLPTTFERGIQYDANAADLIGDNIEDLAGQAAQLASRLTEPDVAVPVVAATALGAAALYYYETTLQVIGLVGLSWSAYSALNKELAKYDTPQEAMAAWSRTVLALATGTANRLQGGKFPQPKYPAPPAAARASEVLARAAAESAAKSSTSSAPATPRATPRAEANSKASDNRVAVSASSRGGSSSSE